MKTLDQINGEIQTSVDTNISLMKSGGLFLTLDEFDENPDSQFEPRVREFLKNQEVSARFNQLLEIATVLEQYLEFASTDGKIERKNLRIKLKMLLTELNS